jgi:membrane-bound ClpP family serine protease
MTVAILLLGAGLLLIVAELLFPSFGLLGVLAALCIVGSIASAFAVGSELGVRFLIATALLVPAMVVIGFKLLPHSPVGKLLVQRGFSFEDGAAIDRRDAELLGHEGVVDSFLRPAGTAHIDGRRVDVISRGEPIEAGARVRVIAVEGNRVVVVRSEDRSSASPDARDTVSSPS